MLSEAGNGVPLGTRLSRVLGNSEEVIVHIEVKRVWKVNPWVQDTVCCTEEHLPPSWAKEVNWP
jgi:hypothetical protein